MVTSRLVKIANQASAEAIAAAADIPSTQTFKDHTLRLRVADALSLSSGEREELWTLYETNMRTLVEPSSFGWDPKSKKKELFHRNARFILAYKEDGSQEDSALVAFTMFRFERDQGEDLLYCYEIQVSESLRGGGIGHFLVDRLAAVGKHWRMSKVMLTVLKSNVSARQFYSKTGFQVDPSSPEYETSESGESVDDIDDGEQVSVDYEILSMSLE